METPIRWLMVSVTTSEPGVYFIINPLDGKLDQFTSISQAQFIFDVGPMRFDRFDTDTQFLGDGASRFAASNRLNDFELSVAESIHRRNIHFAPAGESLVEHLAAHGFADINLSGENPTECGNYVFGGVLFHDVAQGTGSQDSLGIHRFIMHGENEDREKFVNCPQIFDEFDAICSPEGDIDYGCIWLRLLDSSQTSGSIFRFSAHLHVWLLANKLRDPLSHEGMVIH